MDKCSDRHPFARNVRAGLAKSFYKMNFHDSEKRSSTTVSFSLTIYCVCVFIVWAWWAVFRPVLDQPDPGYRIVPGWDLYTYFFPKYVYGTKELLSGRFPLWNPLEYAGVPFFATAQPAVLYPPKILAFGLFDAEVGMQMYLCLHFLALGFFFCFFARSIGVGWFGMLAGAAYWTFNFVSLPTLYHPDRISNLVWLPLLFLFGDRLLRSPSVLPFVSVAVFFAIQLMAGQPEYPLWSGTLLVFYACGVVLTERGATLVSWRRFVLLILALTAGGLLAAVQVFPFVEVLGVADRSGWASNAVESWAEQSDVSLPFVFLRRLPIVLFGVPLLGLLAPAGIGAPRATPVWGTLTFCLVVSMGGWWAIRMLPVLDGIRHPLVWVLCSQFFIAWVIAIGADRFTQCMPGKTGQGGVTSTEHVAQNSWGSEPIRHVAKIIAVFGGAIWALAYLVRVFPDAELSSIDPMVLRILDYLAPLASRTGIEGLGPMAAVLGAAGGLVLAIGVLTPDPLRRVVRLTIAAGLAVTSQVWSFPHGQLVGSLTPLTSADTSSNFLSDEDLEGGRVLSLIDAGTGHPISARRSSVLGTVGSLPPIRAGVFAKRLGIDITTQEMKWEVFTRVPGYLDMLDVRFVVSRRVHAEKLMASGLIATGRGGPRSTLFWNHDTVGRAWGVYGVVVADSPGRALNYAVAPGFDPFRTAIVEAPLEYGYPGRSPVPPTRAKVRYDRDQSGVTVDVDMRGPGVLVLSDACYPGWHATVDDEPVEIFCTNFLLRGVELEQGRHRVRFEYRPASFVWGLWTSITTAICLFLLSMYGWRKSIGERAQSSNDCVGASTGL